jgi:hypothetical protein
MISPQQGEPRTCRTKLSQQKIQKSKKERKMNFIYLLHAIQSFMDTTAY